ncbi:hypothetical protein GCM10027446_01890 [Angustibacter peucedani]
MTADDGLRAAVQGLAGRPLLVGLDFDGVLAPIVERPGHARALPGTIEAVQALAALPSVTVALVSGRALADLSALTGLTPDGDVRLVGSHGAEVAPDPTPVDEAARQRLADVQARLEVLAAEHPGAHVESKPSAAVLHTRSLPAAVSARVTAEALALLAEVEGVHVTRGKEVVEAAVTETSKGRAIGRLRDALGDRAGVLYVGDDVTDETVFTTLQPGDVGVKVGDGDTAAAHRLPDPEAVRTLLQTLPALLRS